MHGLALLETIHSLPQETSAAVFLRHAQRHPIVDASDPTLAELTPAGAAEAEAFGAKIAGFGCVRVFHSPIKRCHQTAECIARGVQATGCPVEIVGPEDALGIDYILDLKEAGRLTVLHGDHFVRLWFSGQIAPTVIHRAERIAARKLTHLVKRLQEPCAQGRRLDLHVSHDWNIIVLRELMVGVRHEEAGWLDFLDGVAFTPVAGGLRAIYRDRGVTKPLPWRLGSAPAIES
ncbi:histidine phosphatase family protein [Opitutus terrae]|uniref:Putative phosphohistidine phosphatase, SixA n=1 Tax=Opitutus terrae (strain DSM 11246 / JCM 15787 / PB90-1) TaxID=452637 RepID=B1ZNS2_OPITP|nr:histidine phosphatase family protein [Opitutus terrae]ACB75442.1 putative phosphohistidine phosphatase, SixA [Opitutus terrae PB90-1]